MWNWTRRWLAKEPLGFWPTLVHVVIFTLTAVIYVNVAIPVFKWLGVDFYSGIRDFAKIDFRSVSIIDAIAFIIAILSAAFIEELLFRAIPIRVLLLSKGELCASLLLFWLFFISFLVLLLANLLSFMAAPLMIVAAYLIGISFVKDNFSRLILGIIGVSIIFGYAHGGLRFVLLQGVGGVLLSLCYVKCGGFAGKWWKPIVSSTSAHFLYNVSVILPALYMQN